jgi:hypothetical protein
VDIIALANELRIATTRTAARDNFARTSEGEFSQWLSAETLNIETIISNPFLPTGRKWAIRFNAGGTVTIILGIRDYWRGWYSAYFASLVTARLGVPPQRVRLYYCASPPAVLVTPVQNPIARQRSLVGPVARAVAEIIKAMCDQTIDKGRLVFALMAGVDAINVGFDQSTGRFALMNSLTIAIYGAERTN